jgi:hypothetical protein
MMGDHPEAPEVDPRPTGTGLVSMDRIERAAKAENEAPPRGGKRIFRRKPVRKWRLPPRPHRIVARSVECDDQVPFGALAA